MKISKPVHEVEQLISINTGKGFVMQIKRVCQHCSGTGRLFDDEEVGREMRLLRVGKNISARTVAKRMGISAAYLSDLELGRRHWRTNLVNNFHNAIS